MNRLRIAPILAVVGLVAAGSAPCPAADQPLRHQDPAGNRASDFEDRPELLAPRRTEAQEDHLAAAVLYTHGRMLLQRQEFAPALRRFQRAWRYDANLVDLMSEVIPLAVNLGREAEVTRYAAIAAEHGAADPALVSRVAAVLSQNEDWARALRLLQREAELREGGPKDAALLALQFELGRHYFLTGDFGASADAFAVVADGLDEPRSFKLSAAETRRILGRAHLTYNLFAESFHRAGRHEQAAEMFRRAHAASPNEPLLMFYLARIDAVRGHAAEALEKLDQYCAARIDDAGTEPYELLAQLVEPGRPLPPGAKLVERLDALRKADPENAPLAYFTAQTLIDAGLLEAAEKVYTERMNDGPSAEIFQGLADIYRRKKDDARLVGVFGQVVKLTGSLRVVDDAVERLLDDPAAAARIVDGETQRLSTGEESAPETRYAAALLAQRAGHEEAADRLMAAATADGQPVESGWVVNWGIGWLIQDKPVPAIAALRRATELELPDDARAELFHYLAGALEATGGTDAALEAARQAARLQPESALHASRLPWVLFHARRLDESKREYLALVERFDERHESDDDREVLRDVRLILSSMAAEQGNLDEAQEWLEQILDEFPEDVGAMNDLGYLWSDANRHLLRSLQMIERAVAAEPDNVAYRDSLGWVLYRLERYDEAVVELERAVAADEHPDGVILDHLGDAYHKAGRTRQAVDSWKKAAEAFGENARPERAETTLEKIRQHDVSE